MRNWIKGAVRLVATAGLFTLGFTQAQVISIATTSGGANAQVGASIAAVVSANSDYQMRPQAMSGSQQSIEAVNRGVADFGLANAMQYYMSVEGFGLGEGNPSENLQIAATLMPFIQGIVVAADSDIHSIADLAGKRLPYGYSSSPLFQTFWEAFLAEADLSYDDVQQVPVPSLPRSWELFREGQVDAVIAAAGSAAVREMDAVVPGGVRYVSIDSSPELLEALPKTRFEIVQPAETLDGVPEPTSMHVYEYVLFVNENVDDEVVRQVVDAINNNIEDLQASTPLWDTYRPQNIGMDHGLEYHPAAVQYYQDQGLWER